jgi:hypothetical protein
MKSKLTDIAVAAIVWSMVLATQILNWLVRS